MEYVKTKELIIHQSLTPLIDDKSVKWHTAKIITSNNRKFKICSKGLTVQYNVTQRYHHFSNISNNDIF